MKFRLFAIVALLCLLVSQGSAQSAKHAKGYKDPKTAVAWSYLLPGTGHMYAGEKGKGFLVLATSVGSLTAGTIMTLNSGGEEVGYDYDFASSGESWTPFYIGSAVYAVGWIYSIVDSGKAAERTNRKRGLSRLGVRVVPYVAGKADRREYGVRLRFDL